MRTLISLLAALVLATTAQASDRIVALGSDVAEILFALGKGGAVVATDDSATFPPASASRPKIGYFRSLTPEPILAQRPSLVLAGEGAGPEAVLRQIAGTGVRIVVVPGGHDAAAVPAKIRAVGRAVGAEAAAERLARDTATALAAVARGQKGAQPRMLLVLATAPGRVLAAGRGTAGDGFIRLAGGRNVFAADGYKPISAEAAIAAAPDVILVPSHVVDTLGGVAGLAKDPVLARTPAAKAGRILVVDSQSALNFGPRLPEAVARVRGTLAKS
jgi:iron complex transport system substrate-binding protein